MDTGYRELLDERYSSLLKDRRIVVLDRQLSENEVLLGYAAVDVHAVLQYRRVNLSANVLKAAAFGKLLVVDAHGHGAMIAQRFDAGHTCDVAHMSSIVDAMRCALERVGSYVPSPAARRLVEFHNISNFTAVALRAALGEAAQNWIGTPRSWEWVCEGLHA
jgi:hypothetical protein